MDRDVLAPTEKRTMNNIHTAKDGVYPNVNLPLGAENVVGEGSFGMS